MMSEVDGIQEQEHDSEFDLKAELQETQRALRETTLMIEQSHGKHRRTQRNAAIYLIAAGANQLGDTPVEEIRMAYDSAWMRSSLFACGQLELQSDKSH
jgi:hypothetical protein